MAEREDLLQVGASLVLDAVAAELVTGLEAEGVGVVVLRGPALLARLYDGAGIRAHDDIDLLVDPASLARVRDVLAARGYERAVDAGYAEPWIRRSDGVTVDVHTSLVGVAAPPAAVWRALGADSARARIGGADLPVLRPAALAFAVALHAAQHGSRVAKPIADLERAVERLPASVWDEARRIAEELAATETLAAGLRLVPQGAALAEELGLPLETSRELRLRATSPPPTSVGYHRFAETRGIGAKAVFLGRELAPPPPFMRALYPVARRGRLGLAAAYLWRPLRLLAYAPSAVRAFRRARRG